MFIIDDIIVGVVLAGAAAAVVAATCEGGSNTNMCGNEMGESNDDDYAND